MAKCLRCGAGNEWIQGKVPLAHPRFRKLTKAKRNALAELLGEGFHTAFRKAIEGPNANIIWNHINDLDCEQWAAVLDFVVDGLDTMVDVKEE